LRAVRPSTARTAQNDSAPEKFTTLDEVERRYIMRVLQAMGQNRDRTATILGITTRTLYRKLQEYSKNDSLD
jgi:DNA-binding NtrC family response regulator